MKGVVNSIVTYVDGELDLDSFLFAPQLCMVACGFGFLANIHPKLEFGLEPKGRMGRLIDNIIDRIDFYDTDKERDTL